jgi:hypothetical protein
MEDRRSSSATGFEESYSRNHAPANILTLAKALFKTYHGEFIGPLVQEQGDR